MTPKITFADAAALHDPCLETLACVWDGPCPHHDDEPDGNLEKP